MVKSLINIEPETSSTSMMSMPLASTCVRLFPSRGRASPMMKQRQRQEQQRAQYLTRARGAALAEAAQHDRGREDERGSGSTLSAQVSDQRQEQEKQEQPRIANENSVPVGSQLRRFKLASFHKARRFLEQQLAVGSRRVVSCKFNQVAALQKITQQFAFISGKR
jgi:hypothetical protein